MVDFASAGTAADDSGDDLDAQAAAIRADLEAKYPGMTLAAAQQKDVQAASTQAQKPYDDYAARLSALREPRSKWDQISQMLIAYGRPTFSKGEALSNAAQAGVDWKEKQRDLEDKYNLTDAEWKFKRDIAGTTAASAREVALIKANAKGKGSGKGYKVEHVERAADGGSDVTYSTPDAIYSAHIARGSNLTVGDAVPPEIAASGKLVSAAPAATPSVAPASLPPGVTAAPGAASAAPVTPAAPAAKPDDLSPTGHRYGEAYELPDHTWAIDTYDKLAQKTSAPTPEETARAVGMSTRASAEASAAVAANTALAAIQTAAQHSNDLLAHAKELLDGGHVITGLGASAALLAARAGAAVGNPDAKIQSEATQEYQLVVQSLAASILKSIVGSTQISNTDVKWVQSLVGANINADPQALARLQGILVQANDDILKRKANDAYAPGSALAAPAGTAAPKANRPPLWS